MTRTRLLTGLSLAAILAASPAAAQEEGNQTTKLDVPTAAASFIDANGEVVGSATFMETPHGVVIRITSEGGLPPGEHGIHIHENGVCDPASGFESAGGHFNPDGASHGYFSENGPHAGDLPNQFVAESGALDSTVFNPNVTLVFGADRSTGDRHPIAGSEVSTAILIHENADDYEDAESGHSGTRIACGVIELAPPFG